MFCCSIPAVSNSEVAIIMMASMIDNSLLVSASLVSLVIVTVILVRRNVKKKGQKNRQHMS